MKKDFFYKKKKPSRQNSIVKWFFENVSKARIRNTLEFYLDTGDISDFERLIESSPEPAFQYIIEEGESESFASRIIRILSVKAPEKRKEGRAVPSRQYGEIKGERVHIERFDSITLVNKKVIVRARDSKGRFMKL